MAGARTPKTRSCRRARTISSALDAFEDELEQIDDDAEDFDREIARIHAMRSAACFAFLARRAATPYGAVFAPIATMS